MKEPLANNPWVPQSPQRVDAIRARYGAAVDKETIKFHGSLLKEWAARDDGPLPSRKDAEAQVRLELELLCRALGRWAALSPEEIFPHEAFESPPFEWGW